MTVRRNKSAAVYYPESDGKPMAESEVHLDVLIDAIVTLKDTFADRPDVYVNGDMFLYYEEGNPRASVSPDLMVVFGVPKLPKRPIYKLWEERVPPAFVLEVTSSSTRRDDLVKKRALYARLGVREYMLFDPLGEYLRPPLQGYRLEAGEYRVIAPRREGTLWSDTLGMFIRNTAGELRFARPNPDDIIPTRAERIAAEAARAEREAARAEREAARAEREAARAEREAARANAETAARLAAEQHVDGIERRLAELERRLAEIEGRTLE
ncbi:MAG: Uma2 family endonuclease [Chloroflexi bacterium]|nr:Uma2 family endonuclease [Chloroflexota bacterium]